MKPTFTPAVIKYWRSRQHALLELDELFEQAPTSAGKEVWLYGRVSEIEVAKGIIDSDVTEGAFQAAVYAFVDDLTSQADDPAERSSRSSLIDVVVASTFRRLVELERCIRSILASNYTDFSVIVVRSGTGTGELPVDITSDERVTCTHELTLGLSRARNKGLSLANAPYVAFTDDDVTVEEDWLSEIVSAFITEPDTACVTGLVIPAEIETPAQARFEREVGGLTIGLSRLRFNCGTPSAMIRRVTIEAGVSETSLTTELPLHVAGGYAGVGANMAFRRAELLKASPFDEYLGAGTPSAGGEEIRLFIELLAAGKTISYVPVAVVRHYHRRSCQELAQQLRGIGSSGSALLIALVLSDFRFAIDWILAEISAPLFDVVQSNVMPKGIGGVDDPEIHQLYKSGLRSGPLSYLRSRYRNVRRSTSPLGN